MPNPNNGPYDAQGCDLLWGCLLVVLPCLAVIFGLIAIGVML